MNNQSANMIKMLTEKLMSNADYHDKICCEEVNCTYFAFADIVIQNDEELERYRAIVIKCAE